MTETARWTAVEIQAIRKRTDIVRLVGEYITMGKYPVGYRGICPFCESPLLAVNRESGLYHCYGCKESGDAVRFLEQVRGCSFADALRHLAARLEGIEA